MQDATKKGEIRAIIGLGNPGRQYQHTRHNIGFRILDEFAQRHGAKWFLNKNAEIVELQINNARLLLLKPQTFMNDSGKVIPSLAKKGIKSESILVVHDELELPFGSVKMRVGGSARGHNGVRSLVQAIGSDFERLRFGIGRPDDKNQVAKYVLDDFSETYYDIENEIKRAVDLIEVRLNA